MTRAIGASRFPTAGGEPWLLPWLAPWLALLLALPGLPAQAADEPPPVSRACLLRELGQADDDVTVGEIKAACREERKKPTGPLLLERLWREETAEDIRSVLTPHQRNYFIPVSYVDDPNENPFVETPAAALQAEDLDHLEAKFQLSLKFSLANGLLLPRDRVYFAFTTMSLWQAYNSDVSSPFRETNYEPELFWVTPVEWAPFGLDAGLVAFGFSHQSNGRGGLLSRSWNRLYATLAFEKKNLVVSLKPWWRIPEDEKDDPLDPEGDDNPDIDRFMGHFELSTVYRRGNHEWSLMLRNNLRSENYGAVQLEWTFPLWRGVRGYAQYFNGYGESLIDYDAHIERFGVGVLLTDLL